MMAEKFDLKPAEIVKLLTYISHRANDKNGRCYFKQTTAAKECGLTVTSIVRASKKLVEKGLVERIKKGILYHYKLNLTPYTESSDTYTQSELTVHTESSQNITTNL